jgi:hypothetical protein
LCWTEKSPLAEIELMTSVRFPVLVRVTAFRPLVCPSVTLPKLRLLGLSEIPAAMAYPVKDAAVDPLTSSVTVSVPEYEPPLAGVKVTETLQLAPGESDFRWQLSDDFENPVPETASRVTVTDVELSPLLVYVNVWELLAPTETVPKSQDPGLNVAPAKAGVGMTSRASSPKRTTATRTRTPVCSLGPLIVPT